MEQARGRPIEREVNFSLSLTRKFDETFVSGRIRYS